MMYYLYLDGRTVKVAHGDQKLALELHNRDYELGNKPFSTREEAEAERSAWQARVDHSSRLLAD
jgi:hypothetical protein